MGEEKNYITPRGAKKLRDELKTLMEVERPEVVRTVSWAASNGDRSENGDYIYGKRRLREIDRRVRFIRKRLEIAHEISPENQNSDKILFGASVTVMNEDGKKIIYSIVGKDESEPTKGKISWISPIAKSLLGKKVDDVVIVKTPKGELELEIIKIEYREII